MRRNHVVRHLLRISTLIVLFFVGMWIPRLPDLFVGGGVTTAANLLSLTLITFLAAAAAAIVMWRTGNTTWQTGLMLVCGLLFSIVGPAVGADAGHTETMRSPAAFCQCDGIMFVNQPNQYASHSITTYSCLGRVHACTTPDRNTTQQNR